MRFVLVVLAAAVAALAQPVTRSVQFNPQGIVLKPIVDDPTVGATTNAKRFALGLPPLQPKSRRHRNGHGAPLDGTRVRSAPRAETSSTPPTNQQCNILVKKSDDGSTLGFVSPVWNEYGEYGALQGDQAGALIVSFPSSTGPASQMDLAAVNGPHAETYPYMGAISGFGSDNNNLEPGSYNYAYMGGTPQTAPGSAASTQANSFTATTDMDSDVQSAIWSYDPVTKAITAQWINDDNSKPSTVLVIVQGVLAMTSDPGAMAEVFGPTDALTFTCVPPATAAPA